MNTYSETSSEDIDQTDIDYSDTSSENYLEYIFLGIFDTSPEDIDKEDYLEYVFLDISDTSSEDIDEEDYIDKSILCNSLHIDKTNDKLTIVI